MTFFMTCKDTFPKLITLRKCLMLVTERPKWATAAEQELRTAYRHLSNIKIKQCRKCVLLHFVEITCN